MTSKAQVAHRIGMRAGAELMHSGKATPNPIVKEEPLLAQAWRRGYMRSQALHRTSKCPQCPDLPAS